MWPAMKPELLSGLCSYCECHYLPYESPSERLSVLGAVLPPGQAESVEGKPSASRRPFQSSPAGGPFFLVNKMSVASESSVLSVL